MRADLRHRPGTRGERLVDPGQRRPGQHHRRAQDLVRAADDHPPRRHVDVRHVAPLAVAAVAHAAPLPHRDELDRTDGAGRAAFAVHHLGGVQLDPPGQEPLAALGAADEAHVLAVGLARRAQPETVGVGPHLVLGHVAHGEDHPGQTRPARASTARRTGPCRGRHRGAAARRRASAVAADAGVVARGQAVEAEPVGPVQQPIELHGAVALNARIRRPPRRVLPHIGRHDVAVELLGQVEDVVGDAELLGHPAGVLDVGDRAAARIGRPAPQLERGADHLVALLHQERRRHGGVDASRHGYEHPHGTSVPPGRRGSAVSAGSGQRLGAGRRPRPGRRRGRGRRRPPSCRSPA